MRTQPKPTPTQTVETVRSVAQTPIVRLRGQKKASHNTSVKDAIEPVSATLRVRVTPRASANAVTRFADGVLSLRLTAPPVEGAANVACCQFVAKLLGVSASQVTVKSGHKSRDKVLTIEGVTQEAVSVLLSSYPSA